METRYCFVDRCSGQPYDGKLTQFRIPRRGERVNSVCTECFSETVDATATICSTMILSRGLPSLFLNIIEETFRSLA